MGDKENKLIYKYRSLNDFTETLINKGELYFAYPNEFNDPFDSKLKLINYVDKVDIPGMLTRGFRGKVTRQLAGER